jgi:hypothetical protein
MYECAVERLVKTHPDMEIWWDSSPLVYHQWATKTIDAAELSCWQVFNDVPAEVMDKLLKIPFCLQAYDPNGLELEQFNDHPSTLSTVEAFLKGFTGLEGFIHDRMTLRQ